MQVETRYRGYMCLNKSFYTKDLKYMIDAEHLYVTVTSQDCFDKDGKRLGVWKDEKYYSNNCVLEYPSPSYERVVQIGFKFMVLKSNFSTNADTIHMVSSELSNSFKGNFKYSYNIDINDGTVMDKSNLDYAELDEICVIGNSRSVVNKMKEDFFDINLKEYSKNLIKFCKENPSFEDDAKSLYRYNVKNLCRFFLCNEKELFTKDLTSYLIKRFERKINKNI